MPTAVINPTQPSHFTYIPLGEVVTFEVLKGPNQISRENSKRRVVVTANVRERDLGSFVKEAQNLVEENVSLSSGYWISWGGQFEHLISAAKRLWVVIPVALMLILFLLFSAFGSLKNSLLVFTGIPLALTGGFFFTLDTRDSFIYFSGRRFYRLVWSRGIKWNRYGFFHR